MAARAGLKQSPATVALSVAKMKTPLSKAHRALLLAGLGPVWWLCAPVASSSPEPLMLAQRPQRPATGQRLPWPLTHLQRPSLALPLVYF